MKTPRLHYDDPLLLSGAATLIEVARFSDRPSAILDATLFYPESGGQMGDHGRIDDAEVLDVQLDDRGRVHHLLASPIDGAPKTVRIEVDETRRRAHMALHTAQHALSRALLDRLGATTLSSRLGASACTIDVDRAGLTTSELGPIEDAINALVDEDREVRQRFVDEDELARLALRKPPPETDRVRVVEIDGFDTTPCGGTHATSTAQIELVVITSAERYKGGTRISFEAGPRGRRTLKSSFDRLRDTAAALRCAPDEVDAIVAGLKDKLDAAQRGAGELRARLADALAAGLLGRRDGSAIVAALDGVDAELLGALASRLATDEVVVVLGARSAEQMTVIAKRGPRSSADSGALLRAIVTAGGGRGGGRPEQAQGKMRADADLEALARAAGL
ncbi:MAG: alanyl-tRNA editing protein [Sandaracinaceae bacterium]